MDLTAFGRLLHELRIGTGMTQDELAGRLHISADLVSKWERAYEYRGRRWKPDRDSIIRLVQLFADHLSPAKARRWAALAGYNLHETELQEILPAAAFSPPAPIQLPPLPAIHISRVIVEQILLAQFQTQQSHTLVLLGPGGTGKTTLAAWLARTLVEDFPDGVIWVEMQPDDDPAKAQDWIARSLGVELSESALPARTGELRSLLYQKQCLVVLDDLWVVPGLRHLQIGSDTTRLLVTTRDAKVANILNAPFFRVSGMTHYEGVALLEAWVEHNLGTRQANDLVAQLGGLPLALRLSGAQLRAGVKLAALLDALAAKHTNLNVLDMDEPENRDESLTLCFDLSYDSLAAPLRQRFEQLAYFAGVLDEMAVAAVWQVEPDEASRTLGRLYRLALLEQDARGYRLHPLLRAYAWQKLAARTGKAHPDQHRYAAWYIRNSLYHPGVLDSATKPAPALDHTWADVISAVKWAANHEPHLAAQAAFLAHTERPALLAEVGPALITAVANYLTGLDREPERAFILELLAGLHLLTGEFEAGLTTFEEASQTWQMLENWLAGSQAKLRAAGTHLLIGQWAEAASAARQAQTQLEKGLGQLPDYPDVARWLFYWFNMVYNPLARWVYLPEADVANLAGLAAQTGNTLLEARGLHIYRLWCTAHVSRPAAARDKGRELALEAYKLWRACGRKDRADDEICWTNYRLNGRYSQRSAARYAQRRSQTTPVVSQSQLRLIKSEGIRWWLGATPDQRVGWLSRMLPRHLAAANAPAPPLPPGSRAKVWVDDILNVSVLGKKERRLSLVTPAPPGHILNGPEWYVLSGQKVLPLAGQAAVQQTARYLATLEQRFK